MSRSRSRRVMARGAAMLIALSMVLALGLALLHAPFVERAAAGLISSQASEAVGGRVEFGHLDYRLWRGEAVVTGLTVESGSVLPGSSLSVRAKRVEVRLETLLQVAVRVDSPRVEIHSRPDTASTPSSGDTGPAEALDPRPPSWLGALRVSDGRLRVATSGVELDLSSIGLAFDAGEETFDGTLTVGHGAAVIHGADLELRRAELVARGDESGVKVSRAVVDVRGGRVEGGGVVERLRPFTSRFDGDLFLEGRLVEKVVSQPVAGRLSSQLAVSFESGRFEASGDLEADDVETGRVGPLALSAQFHLKDQTLAVKPLHVEGPEGIVEGSATIGLSSNATQSLDVTLRHVSLETILERLAGRAPVASSISGTVYARVEDWSLRTLDGNATLSLEAAKGRHPRSLSGSLSASADNGRVEFHTRNLAIGEAVGKIDGAIDPDGFRASFRVEALSLETVTEAFPGSMPTWIGGRIGVEGNASGERLALDGMTARARLLSSTLRLGGRGFDVRARGGLAHGQVHVEELAVESRTGGGRLEARGTMEPSTGQMSLDLQGDAISARSDRWTAVVRRLDLALKGPALRPSGSMTAELGELSFGEHELPDLLLSGSSNGSTVSVGVGSVGSERSNRGEEAGEREFLSAELELRPRYPMEARLDLSGAPLQEILSALSGEGALTPRLRVSGEAWAAAELATPADVFFGGRVESLEIEPRDRVAFRTAEPFTFQGDASAVEVREVELTGEGIELHGDGVLALGGNAQHDLRIDGVLGLEALQGLYGDIRVGGHLELDLSVEGPPATPSVMGWARLEGGRFARDLLEAREVSFRLEARDDRIELERLSGKLLGGSLEASGSLVLRNRERFADAPPGALRLEARELELAPFLGADDGVDRSLVVSAAAVLDVAELDLSRVEGEGNVSELRGRLAGKRLRGQPTSFRLTEGTVRLAPLRLEGEATDLLTEAEVTLIPTLRWSLSARGDADLALANSFIPGGAAAGAVRVDMEVSGGPDEEALRLRGTADVEGATLSVESPPLAADDLEAHIELQTQRVVLEGLQARLGGGNLEANGFYDLAPPGEQAGRVKMQATMTSVRLEYPEGLKSTTSAELGFESVGEGYLLSGDVQLREALYDRDITVERELLSILSREAEVIQRQRTFGETVRLDLQVASERDLRVRNNLADASLTAELDVTGTLAAPELRGTIATRSGGTIVFAGRTYELQIAEVTFDGYPLTEPIVDVSAHTEVGGTPVQLEVSGRTGELSTSLRAPEDPSLSRADVASLLFTGRTVEEVRGEEVEALGEGLAGYLGGSLANITSGGLAEALPVSRISVQPKLVGRETDPGARFSLGQAVTEDIFLTYSIGLNDAEEQLWIVEYSLPKRLTARMTRNDDNEYSANLAQELFLGRDDGAPVGLPPAERPTVSASRVEGFQGELPLAEEMVREALSLEEGDEYDYWEARRGADALRRRLREHGFLNARVEVQTRPEQPAGVESVEVLYRIEAGQPVTLSFEGDDPGSEIRREIREGWDGLLPAAVAAAELAREARWLLRSEGYYAAEVTSSVREREDGILAVFRFDKGNRGGEVRLRFEGNEVISDEELERALPDTGSPDFHESLLAEPERLQDRLQLLYAARGYTDAAIEAPRVSLSESGPALEVTFDIDEGTAQRVVSLRFEGASSLAEPVLRKSLTLREGERFGLDLYLSDRRTLHSVYRREGFPEATVRGRIRQGDEGIEVAFLIDEGPRVRVGDIVVRGAEKGREAVIRDELSFSRGEPLRLGELELSERRLYDLELFQFVDVAAAPAQDTSEQATVRDVIVEVQERPSLLVDYGVRFSTEEHLEGSIDLRFPGLLGSSRQLQLTAFANTRDQVMRLNLHSPRVFGLDIDSDLYLSREDEESASSDTRTWSLTYQQGRNLTPNTRAQWSYSFRRVHTVGHVMSGPFAFDVTTNRSILSASLIRDSRDDVGRPTRGRFWSGTVQFAPEQLGSDLRFVKGFGQLFAFQRLPGDLVWASSYRLGLSAGFGQVLLEQDRFQAGGANSVRGFELDQLGPIDPRTGTRIGGEALFVVNQEVRAPVWKWVGVVAFLDAGNVYLETSDFDPTDLRASAGLGLRFQLPVGLVRVDWARVLDPEPGEERSRFHFSFGHAF